MGPTGRIRALTISFLTSFCISTAFGKDINVGPTRTIKTLSAGVASAAAGDRVLLDAGTYTNDVTAITTPLTIEGSGAGASLVATQAISNRKGILVVNADLTVRNITFQGARVTVSDGNNGAGIRLETGNLVVDNCNFVENQNGILANGSSGATIVISSSTFSGNGAGDGFSHGIYVNEVRELIVSNSTFTGTNVGHSIKSRALRSTITDTAIDDGVTGSSSYGIDFPNGGIVVIDNVRIAQGPNTQNVSMLAYGAEGNLKQTNSLSISNSAFINQLKSGSSIGVNNFTTEVAAALTNNTFTDLAIPLNGIGRINGGRVSHR